MEYAVAIFVDGLGGAKKAERNQAAFLTARLDPLLTLVARVGRGT